MNRLSIGDYVKHFKREISDIHQNKLVYVYKILMFATHSETKEKYVVYQALYSDEIFVRSYDMFMSEVDHVKYPQIKQKYRFEKLENSYFECKGFYYDKFCLLNYDKNHEHCPIPCELTCSKFIGDVNV